ncbi:alpha/beta hydrolase [Pseudomonas entomophila]|uniref:alpha/beta hydrolase n=1 Tax=Pseudomonas entomophila TaxID=312306 RepID=UPI0015E42062|nr:alpha/beta fold hydrolase [Pseudomonas entomophila]MBA1189461.1 alpha/beta hydrolase [Pseudomonas entomophila]
MPDVASQAFSRPSPMRVPRAYASLFEQAETDHFVVGDLEVRTHVWTGPASVLCVHGANGSSTQFGALIERLRDAGRGVMAVDIPSHDPNGRFIPSRHIWQALVDVQRYAVPAAVVAHSMACGWAMKALVAGLPAQQLVCLSPAATQDYVFKRFLELQQVQGLTLDALAQDIDEAFGSTWRQAYSPIELCKTLTLPVLIHHDEDDPVIEWEAGGKVLHDAWPCSRYVQTQGLGHAGIFRNQPMLECLMAFLAGSMTDLSQGVVQ